MPFPSIKINKTDELISLPLLRPEMAQSVIKQCQQAPFGKGTKTVTDKNVRECWQLDSSDISITNPKWEEAITELVHTSVAPQLGIEKSESCVRAELYKMLLYEKGGHFKPHRDSEKADGMFGTMIIQLPSVFTGGAIVVKHAKKTHVIDFAAAASGLEYSFQFGAFYADCEHEVQPLESGYRLALIYNLVFTGKGNVPQAPQAMEGTALAKLLTEFNDEEGDCELQRVVIPLAHMYSETSLSVKNLKGKDANLFALLRAPATQGLIQVQLGLLEIHAEGSQGGDMEQTYSVKIHRVFDSGSLNESALFDPPISLEDIGSDSIVSVHTKLSSLEPYDHTSSPTGNEGTEVERFYHTSALILVPGYRSQDVFFDKNNIKPFVERLRAACDRKTPEAWRDVDLMLKRLLHHREFRRELVVIKEILSKLLKAKQLPEQARELIAYTVGASLSADEFISYMGKYRAAYGESEHLQFDEFIVLWLRDSDPFEKIISFAEAIFKHSVGSESLVPKGAVLWILRSVVNMFGSKIDRSGTAPALTAAQWKSQYQLLVDFLGRLPAEMADQTKRNLVHTLTRPHRMHFVRGVFFSSKSDNLQFMEEMAKLGGASGELWSDMQPGLLAWAAQFFSKSNAASFVAEVMKLQKLGSSENVPEKQKTLMALLCVPVQQWQGKLQYASDVANYVSALPDPSTQSQVKDTYLRSLSDQSKLLSALRDLAKTSASDWRKMLQALSSMQPTFFTDFVSKFLAVCTQPAAQIPHYYYPQTNVTTPLQQVLPLPAAAVIAALYSLNGQANLQEALLPSLLGLGRDILFQFASALKTCLLEVGVDPTKNPMFTTVALEAYKQQKAFVDAEIHNINSGAAALPVAQAWPCGTRCPTCGVAVLQFLKSNEQIMIWTCRYSTKHCKVRDSNHVRDAAVKAGIQCEVLPSYQVKLTKDVAAIRQRLLASVQSQMARFQSLISGLPTTTPITTTPAATPAAITQAPPPTRMPQAPKSILIDLTADEGGDVSEPAAKRRKI